MRAVNSSKGASPYWHRMYYTQALELELNHRFLKSIAISLES